MSGPSAVDYGALAETIDISDITSNEDAADILRQLRDNEPIFGGLCVHSTRFLLLQGRALCER